MPGFPCHLDPPTCGPWLFTRTVPSTQHTLPYPHQISALTLILRSQLSCHLLQEALLDASGWIKTHSALPHHSCAPTVGLSTLWMEALFPPQERGKAAARTGRLLHTQLHLALYPHHLWGHLGFRGGN